MTSQVTLTVYRNLDNRLKGEPDNGQLAWTAHRDRLDVLRDILSDDAFPVSAWGGANDTATTHEVVDVVIDIVKDPTSHGVALAAATLVLKILTKPLEDRIERAVQELFGRLLMAFRKQMIGNFAITFPDGVAITCPSVTTAEVRVGPNQVHAVDIERFHN
ncbi:MAG TPA: hypothetical protein VGH20_06790 [Myxococcales bacterium]